TNVFTSSWAEIALFLKTTGDDTGTENATALQTNPSLRPLPLYTLHLRQRLLVPADDDVHPRMLPPGGGQQWAFKIKNGNAPNYPGASNTDPAPAPTASAAGVQQKIYFNNPADITQPVRRFGSNGLLLAGPTAPSNQGGAGINYLRFLDESAAQ